MSKFAREMMRFSPIYEQLCCASIINKTMNKQKPYSVSLRARTVHGPQPMSIRGPSDGGWSVDFCLRTIRGREVSISAHLWSLLILNFMLDVCYCVSVERRHTRTIANDVSMTMFYFASVRQFYQPVKYVALQVSLNCNIMLKFRFQQLKLTSLSSD